MKKKVQEKVQSIIDHEKRLAQFVKGQSFPSRSGYGLQISFTFCPLEFKRDQKKEKKEDRFTLERNLSWCINDFDFHRELSIVLLILLLKGIRNSAHSRF